MPKKLNFDLNEYGIYYATPIEYQVFKVGDGWSASVLDCFDAYEDDAVNLGYLNTKGVVACSLEDGMKDMPKECIFNSQKEAEKACQDHFNKFLVSLHYDCM